MCGIVGIASKENTTQWLIETLKKLEYRGYDSAGLAIIEGLGGAKESCGAIAKQKAEGKIINLEKKLATHPLAGNTGIAHTRWATHGIPSHRNAHPHSTAEVAIVHNGIIENYAELKATLEQEGYQFTSETDSEVISALITKYLEQGNNSPLVAMQKACASFKGAYAIASIFKGQQEKIIVARKGSPLAIGVGDGENFVASDAVALAGYTNKVIYLEEGDTAEVTPEEIHIYDETGAKTQRNIITANIGNLQIGKGDYKHFMLKEIHEQPDIISNIIHSYYLPLTGQVKLPPSNNIDFAGVKNITIIGCGTSFYAGIIAKTWLERYAGLPTSIEIASEFRYKEPIFREGELFIFISQSGETADSLAALKFIKSHNQPSIAVLNVTQSSIAREADLVLPIYSGAEIGVASTKAFTSALLVLLSLSLYIGERKKLVAGNFLKQNYQAISELPRIMQSILADVSLYEKIGSDLAKASSIIYVGRGLSYGIALEGALKLKELSYIHAEATAAGELKHGPIALIDENVPVIAIAPKDDIFEKTASNIAEIIARKGDVYLVSCQQGADAIRDMVRTKNIVINENLLGKSNFHLSPFIYVLPMQLLAYYTATTKGTDIDQPRNLAKSVTVE